MEATPRPWTFDPKSEQIWSPEGLVATVKQRGPLVESDGNFRLLETEANGEFIVKAANAHDRLVEALAAVEWTKCDVGHCPLCGGWPNVGHIDGCRIAAALALARGEVE